MNLLEAKITKIVSVTERDGYWYVKYQYDVWGRMEQDERRFKYREDAEKLKVGETIIV